MPLMTCSACKVQFTGLAPFDAHQDDTDEPPFTVCYPPTDVGLVQNDLGRWGGGGDVDIAKATYIPAAARPAQDYEVECRDCGTIFERPRRRGRPPTKCEGCR